MIDKPHPGYVVRGNQVVFKAKGQFTGVQGVASKVKLKQSPMDSALLRSLSATPDLLPIEPGTEKGFSSVSQLSKRVGYWVVPKHREPAGNCPSDLGESPETELKPALSLPFAQRLNLRANGYLYVVQNRRLST